MKGSPVVLAFLDAKTHGRAPYVVPVRSGTLLDVRSLGEFCVLEFRLGDYVCADDMNSFNIDVLELLKGEMPAWGSDGKLHGRWVHEVRGVRGRCIHEPQDEVWQRVTKQLQTTPDFAGEPFFYRVRSIHRDDGRACAEKAGVFQLPPGKQVSVEVEHFNPRDDDDALDGGEQKKRWLVAQCEGSAIVATSSTRLLVDSPYDTQRISLRTARRGSGERCLVRFSREASGGETVSGQLTSDFEVPMQVRREVARPALAGAFFGLLLAAQQWDRILVNGQVDKMRAIVAAALGVAAGLVAAFGLKKPW